MLTKNDICDKAYELSFVDIGFTTVEPFYSHKEILLSREDDYAWIIDKGLMEGTDPLSSMPEGKTIIVLLEAYFRHAVPPAFEGRFGRCYLDDDRVTKDGLALRVKVFRNYLREHGISSKITPYLPQRMAAARAGLGTFGKNCLFYSNKTVRQSSWVSPVTLIVDQEFLPDEPTVEVNCPTWCKNACIAGCPTRALSGPRKVNPQKCISYLSYYGKGITPLDLREQMGMWVYGCDHCQNVCPRNAPWLSQELSPNERVADRAENFDLTQLLHMDEEYFKTRIWPHMFYMSAKYIWRWQMNAARVMGNSKDSSYIPDLIRALHENQDERVQGMAAWALGRLGGSQAKEALANALCDSSGLVREEIERALKGKFSAS